MIDIESWRAAAIATGPADRARAHAAVYRAYTLAGLPAPTTVLWADSPLAGVGMVRALADRGRSVREQVRTRPWSAERARVTAELGGSGWAQRWSETGGPLWETSRMLTDRIRLGIVAELVGLPRPRRTDRARQRAEEAARRAAEAARQAAEAALRVVLSEAVLGQQDAAWLAAFDDTDPRVAALAEVARSAGWWWPYENAVVLCERPTRLLRDEAGRLHSGDGPACEFPDGFALHAWSGMPMPAELFAQLPALTPERIRAEENAEVRRVMLEFFGYERYLAESGARPEHRDETGILWRVELADDEDVVMVEVVNSTAEPDGTFRTYWLRVPPATRTARAGVAWTFGLDEAGYQPMRQT